MTGGDKGELFILFVPLFTLSLLSKIVCSLWQKVCSYPHKLLVKRRQVTAHIRIIHDTVLEKTAPVGILNDTLNLLHE